jgi:integrase
MSLLFVLYKNKPLKSGKYPVRLKLYFGKEHFISLGESAYPTEWNAQAGRFTARADHYEEKNAELRKQENKARAILAEMDEFSFQEFKTKFKGEHTNTTVRGFLEDFIQELVDKGKIGNSKKYRQLQNMLYKFEKAPFTFRDVTYIFLNRFEVFLGKRRIKNSSMHFYMRHLRASVNEAIRRGILDEKLYPFATQFNKNGYSFAHLKGDYNPKPLSLPDLDVLKKFDVSEHPHLKHTYDIFIFLIRARGLNFVDLCELKRDNLHDGRMQYVRQKTGKLYSIKVTPEMTEIIEQYIGEEYLFPIMDTAPEDLSARYHYVRKALKVFNNQLKEIGELCSLKRKLTSYTARYTYTNVLVKNKVSVPLISQALGHASIEVTQHYIEKYADSEVDKVDALI